MNWKKFILLACMTACIFAVSPARAQMRGHAGSMGGMGGVRGMPMHRAPMPGSMGRMPMQRNPMLNSASGFRRFNRFNDGDFDRDDRFNRFNRFHRFNNFNQVIFIGDFGFPWWWGWGWGPWWGGSWGYPYGYYGGYGSGYGYGDSSRSRVAELQRRLAQAGYYHGAIDGIMGPATRRAIRAYERHNGYVG